MWNMLDVVVGFRVFVLSVCVLFFACVSDFHAEGLWGSGDGGEVCPQLPVRLEDEAACSHPTQ